MARYCAMIAAVYVLLLSPWWIRNAITFNQWIPFTQSAGSPFLLGTMIHGNPPDEAFFEYHPEYKESLFHGNDSDLMTAGFRILEFGLKSAPLEYAYWYTLGKMIELYIPPYYWKPILGVSETAMRIFQYLLVICGLIGLIITFVSRKLRTTSFAVLTLTLGYYTFIYLPFVAFSRYGYPHLFIIILFAAYAINRAVELVQSKRTQVGRTLLRQKAAAIGGGRGR